MTYRDIVNKLDKALILFKQLYGREPNRIIMSRNYINIIKTEYRIYDLEIFECDMTHRDIPIVIDECSTSKISVGFLLNC